EVSTQPLYPWLDNKTFNKWFIPDGYDMVFSLLPIEEAERCDFRKGAFQEMLSFFEEQGFISQQPARDSIILHQRNLFPEQLLFIVCGPTCAGKTTLAHYIASQYPYYHIEASDYMYLSYYRSHGVGSSVFIGDFAENALLD